MQSDKIIQYTQLIPKIKTRTKQLKNRRNKKIYRINQVVDPTMTLVSPTEVADDPNIKKENLMKINTYFETVVLQQAKMNVDGGKCDYKALYAACKSQILDQLNKIEDAITKLQMKIQGRAAKFFEEFGNGGFNDDKKYLGELENLIVTLTLKKQEVPSSEIFANMKKYLSSETQKIVESLKNMLAEISKDSSQNLANAFSNSVIVKSNENEMICKWVKDQVGVSKTFECIFNTKDHGFASEAFHSRCDEKGSTIVFVETTTGKRFGGYANCSWPKLKGSQTDEKCFIFSLDLKEKYLHKPGNKDSIHHLSSWGPRFGYNGGNCDFAIDENCNNNRNSYCTGSKTYDWKSRTQQDFAGGANFTVKNYEVYLVKQSEF